MQPARWSRQGWASHHIGEHWVNIGTFAIVAVAMVVGSLLKPRKGGEDMPEHWFWWLLGRSLRRLVLDDHRLRRHQGRG